MRFGSIPLDQAPGAVLAHSLVLPDGKLGKGRVLSLEDVERMRAAGLSEVTVARADPGEIDENTAAQRLGEALRAEAIDARAPVGGRVNMVAEADGLFRVRTGVITAINAHDEAITLATLPDRTRVRRGQIVATVKIIPYAVAGQTLEAALADAAPGALSVQPNTITRAALILTSTPGMKATLMDKAQKVTEARLAAIGVTLDQVERVPHRSGDVADALKSTQAPLVLILTASATSDRGDVAPAGVQAAGGRLIRFGMPVDPGNLLFLGDIGTRIVVGLPGCARSPALNGADWVLQRLVAGEEVDDADFAAMGVGGLLKEIPQRAQPRAGLPARAGSGAHVSVLVLAAGQSRRMQGSDKLLQMIDGTPLLRRAVAAALASAARDVAVALPPDSADRRAALADLDARIVTVADHDEGMAASIRAGVRALPAQADAVILTLADMPDLGAPHYDALIAAFDPKQGHEICRAHDGEGRAGHPVLFSRRFFEVLGGLSGDNGARDILRDNADHVIAVPTPGHGATTDLDTPQAWSAWRARRKAAT